MSDSIPSAEQPVETTLDTARARRGSRSQRIFSSFLKWMLIVFAVMQLIMRTMWEPVWGDAIKNLITYSQGMLSLLLIVIWWFTCAPFKQTLIYSLGVPVLLAGAGWLGSIAEIDVDGDMVMSLRYRWEKSSLEKLKEFRESSEAASTEKIQLTSQFSPEDMPAYRGLHRDGVVTGPAIRTDWELNPPTEIWRQPSGGGYSSFAVVDPVVITLEQRDLNEAVVCYEMETGREFWEHQYPASFNALGGPGPRSTPTIHNNMVFTFGCFGDLFCLDLTTGMTLWHVNVLQQFGLPTTTWGMTSSPLIHDENVIVNIGGLKDDSKTALDQPSNGLVAYNIKTGVLSWKSEGLTTPNESLATFLTGATAIEGIPGITLPGYSSPMLATFADQEIILNFDGSALRGNDPTSGKLLWSYPFVAGDYINVAQPLIFENDRLLISSGYGTGSAMLQLSRTAETWTVTPLWTSTRLRCKFSSPVLFNGYVYGLDEGIMVCIDPQNGNRLWKGGRDGLRGKYGHGQMLLVNGQIIVLTESGTLVLIEPSPQELKVNGMVKVLSENVKTWNPMTIAYGKAFVRNATEIACFDLRATSEEAATSPTSDVAEANSPPGN